MELELSLVVGDTAGGAGVAAPHEIVAFMDRVDATTHPDAAARAA